MKRDEILDDIEPEKGTVNHFLWWHKNKPWYFKLKFWFELRYTLIRQWMWRKFKI